MGEDIGKIGRNAEKVHSLDKRRGPLLKRAHARRSVILQRIPEKIR